MANLQDIRRRIRSVKSMQQLTRAMKLVYAAKLRRSQMRMLAARPYAATLGRMFSRLAERAGDYHHPLLDARGDDHYIAVVITSDRGLCGAFNSNLIRAGQQFIRDNEGKKIDLIAIGKKGRDFFHRRGYPLLREYVNITSKNFDYAAAVVIASDIMALFTAEESSIDRVFLIYSEFKSILSQKVTVKELIPVERSNPHGESGASPVGDGGEVLIDYIYEQPPADIFGTLIPRYIETQLFQALLETVASEHGARMTAMDAASKNAGEMVSSLTLNMNRARQANITKELIEVVSGAQALG